MRGGIRLLLLLCIAMCSCQQALEVEAVTYGRETTEGQIMRVVLKNGSDSVSARKSEIVSSDEAVASVIEKGRRFYLLAHRPGTVELVGSFRDRQSSPLEITIEAQAP